MTTNETKRLATVPGVGQLVKIGLWLLLTGTLAHAQTNPPPLDVTAAIVRGIDFFRAQAATNEEAWLCLPVPGQKIARYEKRLIHYKQVEITILGYKYETYEVLVPGSSPSEPLRKETRTRVVGLDPSKDRKEMREVYDPAGPIVHEADVPIYEKETGHQWRMGGLGNNGWAIVALRRCGIPATDPLVAVPANNLRNIVQTFGWSDETHDLAGMTAAFAVMPGDDFRKLTEAGAAKLLDAQLTTGPAAGLWSPVAVNLPMVSAFLKTMSRLADEKKALTTDLTAEQRGKKSATKIKRIEDDIRRIDARTEALQTDTKRISQFGLRLFDALGYAWHYGRINLIDQAEHLTIESWPYLAHNQITADLDSTAQALLALRVAFENGRLPLRAWRPDSPKPSGPGQPPSASDFPAPREIRDVVALALKAVTALRTADGQWSELNIHQPVADFAWLKAMPQLKPNSSPKLRQPVTLVSTVRGAACLANIQMLQTGSARPTALENPVCQPLVQDMLQGKPLAPTNEVFRAPYDMLWQTTALRSSRGKPLRTDFSKWNEVAEWLLRQQAAHGGWGRATVYSVLMPSTSLMALRAVLPETMEPSELASRYDVPHLSTGYYSKQNFLYGHSEYEAPYFTIGALLFLADGLPEGWTPTQ